jgi:hypothetical protein
MSARNRLNFGIPSSAFLQARAELKRSAVADNLSGKSTLSEVRTSSGTFLKKGQVDPPTASLLALFGYQCLCKKKKKPFFLSWQCLV